MPEEIIPPENTAIYRPNFFDRPKGRTLPNSSPAPAGDGTAPFIPNPNYFEGGFFVRAPGGGTEYKVPVADKDLTPAFGAPLGDKGVLALEAIQRLRDALESLAANMGPNFGIPPALVLDLLDPNGEWSESK